MERRPAALTGERFDLVVVGGGLLGGFTAWRAAERGLRVGLLEARDFGSGTTAGSGRVLHGGIRDLGTLRPRAAARARREQAYLAGLAPRLVRPMAVEVRGRRGSARDRLVSALAPGVWNGLRALTAGEGELPPARRVAGTGSGPAFLYHEYQLRSPERLALALADAAHGAGAVVANHVEARELLTRSGRVNGLVARDGLDGARLEIGADAVALAVGGWAPRLWSRWGLSGPEVALARGVHVVLDAAEPERAVTAVAGAEAPAGGVERRIFLYPWEGRVLAGATYTPCEGAPRALRAPGEEVARLLAACRGCFPGAAGLGEPRPLYACAGLYHEVGGAPAAGGRYAGGDRTALVDHAGPERGGVEGLFSSVVGRMTDAPASADRLLAAAAGSLGDRSGAPARPPARALPRARPTPLEEPEAVEPAWLSDPGRLRELVGRAVEEEAARSLADLLFRRTWLGLLGRPPAAELRRLSEEMGDRLAWSAGRREAERARVARLYAAVDRDGGGPPGGVTAGGEGPDRPTPPDPSRPGREAG